MKNAPLLMILELGLPACFASSGLEDDPCGPSPCRGVEVDSCDGLGNCDELEWCGTTLFCDSPVIVPPTCTDPRPACGDSVEVSSCEGWDTCIPFEWCGSTYYCASNDLCDTLPPSCPPGEEFSYELCAPGEVGCRDVMDCAESYACRSPIDCLDPTFEPCLDATSTVLEIGDGQCPDFDSYQPCYETMYCGAPYYCVTVCPQGGEQVAHPSECDNPNDCYSIEHPTGTFPTWCQGNGPVCRAIPTCDGGVEIPLAAGCDDDSFCDYRNVCSRTIQCLFPLDVPG